MSSSHLYAAEREQYANEFSEFLLKIIRNAGGSLKLKDITGHMSQCSTGIRYSIGTSASAINHFLKEHNNLFSIRDGVVSIIESSSKDDDYDSDSSSVEQRTLPLRIENGKGVIIKLFPQFGFIKAKEPFKTEIYFNAKTIKQNVTDLTSSLYIGAVVYFHAKKKTCSDSKCNYVATELRKANENDSHFNSMIPQKIKKNRDTGLYDPMTLDNEGIVQNVFPNLGFIAVKGDINNTVFFHKNRVANFDNIVDLTKVLSKGDMVEFSAHRSTKQDAKARWEATKVWKKSGKIIENKTKETKKSEEIQENNTKEMIKSQHGKLYPRSQGGVIKFGENQLADGDAANYYISGFQVTDISWEFSEGDDVLFDAVKIKSAPGWKAVLVWVGEKPDIILPTCLGDFSEFTDEETEDNLSSCMSHSSNSSMKSVSLKSEHDSSKIIGQKSVKSSRLSNFTDKKEREMHDSSSQHSSQSSLNLSVTSKSLQRSRKEHKKNSFLNKFQNTESNSSSSWGDSPYPADNYSNNSISDSNANNFILKLNQSEVDEVPNEEVQTVSGFSNLKENEINEKVKDEFSHSQEEFRNEKKLSSETKNDLKKASIRKFQCIEGKIVNVYAKFAEVKAKKLGNTVSFFWNNFYCNNMSVDDLELDNLKQVLNVGDTIYFNYFEIVDDDSGQTWQKVSLAWSGSKPKKQKEISPEEFIKQNNLSVSLKNETVIEEDKVMSKKFLKTFEVLNPIEQNDRVSRTESYSEDEFSASADDSQASKHTRITQSPVDYKMMSNAIIEILKKDLFFLDSKVDFNSASEEIINVIIGKNNEEKYKDEFHQTSSLGMNHVNITSSVTCSVCGKAYVSNPSSDNVNTKNLGTQTIITGEVIAQNIFTEC